MVVLNRDIASGFVVIGPILVTAWVAYWFLRFFANLPGTRTLIADPFLRVVVVLAGFIFLTIAAGYLTRTAFGAVGERKLDTTMDRLPGLRIVYKASKVALQTAFDGANDLDHPVRVNAWDGGRLTGFKTGHQTDDGREIVFVPTAPNFTSGLVIEADPARIQATDESVESALARVVSAGFGGNDTAQIYEATPREHPAPED